MPIAILLTVLLVAALGLGLVVLKRVGKSGADQDNHLPGCGNCGYLVRGVSTFECPECGADLREVGIKTPGQMQVSVRGFIVPVAFSLGFLAISVLLIVVIKNFLPDYDAGNCTATLHPNSGQYSSVELHFETFDRIPPGGVHNSPGLSSYTRAAAANPTEPQFDGSREITKLTLRLQPASSSGTTQSIQLEVDPETQQATWADPSGQTHHSQGAFTAQDVRAFFASAGVDTTRKDVINETDELHAALNGIATGRRFALSAFSQRGISSGASSSNAFWWFDALYAAVCLALWLIGLTWIIRRSGREKGT